MLEDLSLCDVTSKAAHAFNSDPSRTFEAQENIIICNNEKGKLLKTCSGHVQFLLYDVVFS